MCLCFPTQCEHSVLLSFYWQLESEFCWLDVAELTDRGHVLSYILDTDFDMDISSL